VALLLHALSNEALTE